MSEDRTTAPTMGNAGDIELPKRRLGAAWREHVYSRIIDLDAEFDRLEPKPADPSEAEWRGGKGRLRAGAGVVSKQPTPWGAWTGVDVERAWVNVHAVVVTTIRLSDPATVSAKLPDIIANAESGLRPDDPRVRRLRGCEAAP